MISYSEIRSYFDYDPNSGELSRKGKVCGWLQQNGYIYVSIHGVEYRANRVIWFWMTGQWPTNDVDHENNKRSDNRWVNLRDATRSQNLINQGTKFNNKSGYKGVTSRGNSHIVRLRINGIPVCFGSYPTALEAAKSYDQEAIKHHGQFAKTNKMLGLI